MEWRSTADRIMAANPEKFTQASLSPQTWAGWFVGQVQRELGGLAPTLELRDCVLHRLGA